MSNTPIQYTVDLNKVLEQINQNLDTIQKDITDLKVVQTRLEGEIKRNQKKLEGEFKGESKELEAKLDGISKRLAAQEFINRSIVVGLFIAFFAGITKLFFQ